jgi:tripartite-type tricarboxylate transporter receptor subunit TctC
MLALLCLAFALQAFKPNEALAQYPERAITFVCAFTAGSGADVLVRYFAEKVSAVAGVPIVVDNKPGALASVAALYTARANPDGYTVLLHTGNSIASNMWIMKDPLVDAASDLMTIATINRQAFMIAVPQGSPATNMADLTALLREKGADGRYAVNANIGIVLAETYKQMADLSTEAIQYQSAAASLNDLVNGHLDFGSYDPVFALSQHREGRFRILGVGAAERLQGAPDVPTLKEQGFDIDQPGWWSAMVPQGTPENVIAEINDWFATVLQQPETVAFLANLGGDPLISSPAEAQAMMLRAIDEWETYVRIARIPQI